MADIDVRLRATMDIGDVVSNVSAIQKSFSRLKLPDNISGNLSKKFAEFASEYDRYQKKIAGGIKTQGDYSQAEKSLNRMRTLYQEIGTEAKKIGNLDLSKMLDLNSGDFGKLTQEIERFKELSKVKIDFSSVKDQINALRGSLKNEKFSGKGGLIDQLVGSINTGKITEIKAAFQSIQEEVAKITPKTDASGNFMAGLVGKLNPANAEAVRTAFQQLGAEFTAAEGKVLPFMKTLDDLQRELEETKGATSQNIVGNIIKFNEEAKNVDRVTASLKKMHAEEFGFNRQIQMIDRQIQSYFGLSQMIRKVGNIAKSAFNTVKELDKAMTETAVVTNFSVGDMWDMLPTYTEQANQLGSTIKDVYDAATLYYQQGLNTNQAMGLANETLKMARIAGMDAAEATDMMTAALRGFNMEINQVSAQRINDVYSQLAAITASNTQEIGTAMEKTASLANSANMDFETTSAFLAQMIETTREAPENLGTAMKTIVARFQEMKKDPTKLVDSEGVAMDVNKVDAALKSIGVALTNTKGEFRDLDDVFLDIASKWDTLSQGQQRYIATTAAGSRQQSRFIAMMSNYDRTMELVEAANNSAGASQKQFEKTMDSMSSKLNRLKNAWNQFTMGLMNNQILKGGIDVLTGFFSIVNKIIDALSKIPPKPFEGLTKSFLTLGATLTGLNFAKNFASGTVMAGAGWWRGEGSIRKNFMSGYNNSYNNRPQYTQDELIGRTVGQRLSDKTLQTFGVQMAEAPVEVKAYLEGITNAENLPEEVKQKIHEIFAGSNNTEITEEQRVKVNTILEQASLQEGNNPAYAQYGIKEEHTAKKMDVLSQKVGNVNSGLITMGATLQRVGSQLGPFGALLSLVGSVMMTLGSTFAMLTVNLQANLAATLKNRDATLSKAIADEGLTLANLKAAASEGVLAMAIGSTLLPLLAVAAAIAAVIIIFKQLDKAIVTNKEKLEELSDAAARASEAYNSAKQDLSELNDSIEQIQSNREAFKGLVAGTAEFNEKLVEANQNIVELINKYPELNDPKYLSTDKNGLMDINQEGLDLVKNKQAQIVGNAAALNALQSAQLKAEENRQKADEILLKSKGEVLKPENIDSDEPIYDSETGEVRVKKEDQRKADLLNQQADAAERISKQQAIYNSLANTELGNREKIAAIYESTYDTARKEAENSKASMDEMRQAYADFYGYTYNKSRKKITDEEGKEIEGITDEVVKDAFPEITVLANVEANGESLDSMMDAIDQKFAKGFGSNSGSLLTDVLSNNIETDEVALQELIQDPQGLREAISELSEKEIAALLNVDESLVADDFKTYADQLANNVEERASKVMEAQAQTYSELGAMMAQAQYGDINFQRSGWQQTVASSVSEQILKLTAEQRNTLNTIGKTLQENVGTDAMSTFLNEASSIYLSTDESLINEFNNALDGINWDSATSRLEGYNKMMRSTQDEIRQMGEDMRTSSDEVNLLGESFDEFLGGDWLNLSENADDFKNAVGEIDGAGILKAAESSDQLKAMLDSGEVSASGLAIALQGVEDGSILQVNDAVLQLVSSLNKVADVALEAHNIVQNFDPGIDYGEGEDFMIENAKKVKEYMDNGEWGNEQLQNYIKMAAGQERWNKALARNKGNLAETARDLQHYATDFSEGTANVWDKLVNEKGADGDTFRHNLDSMEDEALKGRFEEAGVKFDWGGEDGTLRVELGDLTTEEFEQYLQQVGGMSEDYAKLMIQDLANYDATISSTLRANDLAATVETPEFLETRADEKGNAVLTSEDISLIENSPEGEQLLQKVADGLGTTVDKLKDKALQLTDENDEERTDYKELMDDYAKAYFETGGKGLEGLINSKDNPFATSEGELDLSELMKDVLSKGFTETQSLEGAFEAYKTAGETGVYEGVELESGLNFEEFSERIKEITESDQWVTVGETIGQQIVSAMEASALLDRVRNGGMTEEEKAFDSDGKTTQSFEEVVNAVKTSGESKEKQQQDIADYLKNSQTEFAQMSKEDQKTALTGIVEKLNALNFKPEEIATAVRNGLGVNLETEHHGEKGSLTTGEKGQVVLNPEINMDSIHEQASENLKDLEATVETVNYPDSAKTINVTGNVTKMSSGTTTSFFGRATGQNNPNSAFHRVGTMARGSGGGYTISGRPTLLGEEDEELVWEPKQNRAFMVGSNGPQFANISKNAVVWNADQTKRIKKNSGNISSFGTGAKGINNFGTMAGGTKIPGIFTADVTGNITETVPPKKTPEVPVIGKLQIENNKEGSGKEKKSGNFSQTITNDLTLKSLIKNPDEPKEKVKTSVPKTYEGNINASFTLSSKVKTGNLKSELQSSANKASKGLKVKAGTTSTVKTDIDNTAQKKIDKIKRAKPVEIKTKATDTAQKAINNISGKSVEVKVTPNFGANSNWTKTITIKRKGGKDGDGSGAKGTGYHTPYQSLPSIGSAASGRYGRLGPNGKGGPTLTGEKGYEIAWIPSESRSMILGANGPQMIDLPPDAVIWTHEQSKKIMGQKAIPAGSSEKGLTGKKGPNSKKSSSTKTKSTSSTKGDGGGGSDKKTTKKHKTNADNTEKLIKKAGRVIVWWENQERKVDAIQRRIEKNQKDFEKALSKFGATFSSVSDEVGIYVKNLNKSISLNQESKTKADKKLKNISTKTATEKANDKAARKAQKRLDKAKKTKTKKDDKKAEKSLKKAQKKQKGASYKNITWEETKKKGKKTEKVKKKDRINLADYIKYDDKTGAYVIKQGKLDDVGKKSKAKAKAIKEAATKAIETPQGRYNTADDNITKAQDALDEITQKLYDTFLGWETELTKIWNLTQKISNVEAKTNRLKEAISLQEAQLASGLYTATSSFNKETLSTFSAQMKTMNESINTRGNLIEEQKKKLEDLFTGQSNKNTLANVNKIINNDAKADKAKANYEKKKTNLTKKNKAVKSTQSLLNIRKKELANTSNPIERMKLQKEISGLETKLAKQQKEQATAKKAYSSAKTAYDKVSKDNISSEKLDLRKKEKEELENQEKLRKDALKYLTYSQNGDGTYNISFDTDRFETDKENLGLSTDYGKKIEDYVKDIQTLNEELNNSYTEQTQSLTELYTTLADLKQERADNAGELLDIVENEQQKELEKIRGLSESLNESIRDLLDEVKERLTERRNREDNLKTEQDISKKQQRLAALRADTSGGHAVEIAQLEREIAEAQQSYGRTLEDQLLDRLQRQADEASKQRERMIELQENLLEMSGEQSNVAKVNQWMWRIEQASKGLIPEKEMTSLWQEIKEQYRSNKNYDKVTIPEQEIIDQDFEQFKTELETNFGKQEATKTAIETANTELGKLTEALGALKTAILKGTPQIKGEDEIKKEEEERKKREAEAKAAELKKKKDAYTAKINAVDKNGVIGKDEFAKVKDLANNAGISARTYMADLADTGLTWRQVIVAALENGFDKYRMLVTFEDNSYFRQGYNEAFGYRLTGHITPFENDLAIAKALKKEKYAFATGGLNTQTGPAWLDGTPAKPELVLNAADTKNFLALRDVLSNVMGSINSTDNSYRSSDTFNINVNVDKIANDYDVDKMVEKVKKEITKSAGYRNVTQARAFR